MEETTGETAICPYCGSKFENSEQLSKHTDRVHGGSGLLEGNARQY